MVTDVQKIIENLQGMARHTRVFASMPYVENITPVCMEKPEVRSFFDASIHGWRRDGIFALNEIGLSPLDHGNLYGDAVFEGIRVENRRIILLKEHIFRWFESAQRIGLKFPYTESEIAEILVKLCKETLENGGTDAYIRPVLTRGIGNLGVNPAKCLAPTLYIICSSISLYPADCYKKGIDMSIARKIRRNDPSHLDPNIKSNNYLNNVLALLETYETGAHETIMLTNDGYIAEATADNLFVAERIDDHLRLTCPAPEYALVGTTRNLVIQAAREIGMEVIESPTLLPTDLIGPNREVFITGTACGLMPVRSIDGLPTASNHDILNRLREPIQALKKRHAYGLSIDANSEEIQSYMQIPASLKPWDNYTISH